MAGKRNMAEFSFKLSSDIEDLKKGMDDAKRDITRFEKDSKTSFNGLSGDINKSVTEIKGSLGKITGIVGGGILAFQTLKGTVQTFDKAIQSTDTTADQFEGTMGEINAGTTYFLKSLATGDWSNFITNMQTAIREGREYVETMDAIGDRSRSNRMLTADELKRSKELELIWRAKRGTLKEQETALKEWQNLQEAAAIREEGIAEDTYRAELDRIASVNHMNAQSLEDSLRDYGKYEQQIEALMKAGVFSTFKSLKQNLGEEGALNAALFLEDGQYRRLTEQEKEIFKMFKDLGMVSEEERVKVVELYEAWRTAEASVLDGQIKSARAESRLNKELDKTNESLNKRTEIVAKGANTPTTSMIDKNALGGVNSSIQNNFKPKLLQMPDESSRVAPADSINNLNFELSKQTEILNTATIGSQEYISAQNKIAEVTERLSSLTNKNTSAISTGLTLMEESAISVGEAFGEMAASGKASFRSLLSVLIQTATATIMTYMVESQAKLASDSVKKMGWAGLALAAVGITAVGTLFQSLLSKMPKSQEGLIPGSSFRGDSIPTMVNSGEGIINRTDQLNLWKMIKNPQYSQDGGVHHIVDIRLDRNELRATLNLDNKLRRQK
jgi:hypothetical protein